MLIPICSSLKVKCLPGILAQNEHKAQYLQYLPVHAVHNSKLNGPKLFIGPPIPSSCHAQLCPDIMPEATHKLHNPPHDHSQTYNGGIP